jgi:hypothetical protein
MADLAFKRVPEGWVYCAPTPWLVGSRQYYVLREEQKSALAARLRNAWRLLFAAIM